MIINLLLRIRLTDFEHTWPFVPGVVYFQKWALFQEMAWCQSAENLVFKQWLPQTDFGHSRVKGSSLFIIFFKLPQGFKLH